ncbi:MAG: T9SS type A sorting domain-containing protein [Flavobacteriaceae bacterium]|nr:T9SS type A sorting domain-containing protein [Flavobacteriaceae bacterium]
MTKKLLFTLMCISIFFSGFAQIPTNGLVGHYKLNDGTYEDSSPSALDLEVAGIGILLPVNDRFGASDQALLFINEYLDLISNPNAFNFNADSNFTLCAWIEIGESIADWTGLLNNWNGAGAGGYYLGLNPDQGVRWNVNGPLPIDSGSIPTGDWTHVAATYDGVNSNLYINGVSVGSAANNTPIVASPLPFTIATQADVPNLQFPGKLDDILVYDRALSFVEIEDIFNVLSIEDIEAFSSKVKVYPNPTNASVSVSYDRTLGTISDYNITDLQGRVILSNLLKGLDNSIDVSLMNSGVYLLSFNTVDGNTFTKKIIKK